MIRRKSGLSLPAGSRVEPEVNPMETVANLSDVMLVLAVALMLAIVTHWKVDMSQVTQIDTESLEKVEASEGQEEQSMDTSSTYEEIGKVYRDVETGDVYVVSNE